MTVNPTQNISSLTLSKLTNLSYRSGELKPYLDTICENIIEILGEGIAAVNYYKEGKKHVLAVIPKDRHKEGALEAHGYLSTYVVNHQQVLNVEDATMTPEYGIPPKGYCSYLGIPLKLPNGEIVGTLCYFNQRKRHYTQEEQQISELFAERAAIALDNYEQFHQLKCYSDTLKTLVDQRTKELLGVREELVQKEKLAAIGEFASRITHEIRNPLATIGLALEYLQKTENINAKKRAVLATTEVNRLETLLNEVLLYSKPTQLNCQSVSLSQWLDDFLLTHDSLSQKCQLHFIHHKKSEVMVNADANKLTQICLNLLRNACDASSAGNEINWVTGIEDSMGFISVHNMGDIIPSSKLELITEPFVSAKAGGSGLGLAIVKSLISAHQGKLSIQSDKKTGTTITLFLPITNL
ncbi:MAG: GAF domain-containing protein [Methylomarinum sp.]|nr:GAF domain-containing protein [Methylomarinum sp.]